MTVGAPRRLGSLGGLGLTALAFLAVPSAAWAFGPVAPAAAAPASPTPPPPSAKPDKPAPAAAPRAVAPTQASSPPTPARLAEARLHFQQGVALFREQNYDAALAEFQGAYGISSEPVVLYNLGLTYKALFRYPEAIETLERYVSESAAKGHPVAKDRRAEVETIVAEMRSLLADVTIVLTPPDAALRVDGRPVVLGVDGVVKLPAGSHVIEANAADYMAARREITVVAGTPQSVPLALTAIPRTGSVTITASQIGAHIVVDGKDVGAAPVTLELGAGGHQVEVTAPGYAPGRSELAVAPGQARTVNIVLELPPEARMPTPFYHKWWFWAGVGGVAAVTAGTILLWPEQKQGPLSGTLGTANTAVTSP
ncbi:MAG TPA: PEGA domain-containing protein [Polyangia bacterium]